MPANGEGSNSSSLLKICSSHSYGYGYLLQYLATTSFHLLARANSTPMKRSVRQLSSVLLLIVVAATLSCQVAVRRGFASVQPKNGLALVEKSVVVPVLNATLLKFAAVDLGEAQLNKQIEQLLEGNLGNHGRHRSFLPSGRYNRLNIPARSSRGIQAQLRSPQFNRLWLDFRRNLQDWWRNKRLQSDIMSKLISLVRVPIDRHNGLVGSERRYSSCAVVGNSGILLKSEYGELIDGHEVVIRLNNARTGGFEHNVGSKTNISFINSNILHLCARRGGCFCHPYGETVPVVMYICQPAHFLDYTLCNSSHRAPLLITDPRFDGLCTRIVKYYSLKRFMEEMKKPLEEWGSAHDGSLFHYSSGMQAVMLALGICDNVSIFGFGKLASAKHHYHSNQKAELHLHDYEAEYDLYRDLVEKPQVIPFVSDKFKLPPVIDKLGVKERKQWLTYQSADIKMLDVRFKDNWLHCTKKGSIQALCVPRKKDWLEETLSFLEEQRKHEIKMEKYKKIERHSTCCTPADSCIQVSIVASTSSDTIPIPLNLQVKVLYIDHAAEV